MKALLSGILAFAIPVAIYAVVARLRLTPGSTRLLAPILFAGAPICVLALGVIDPGPDVIAEMVLAAALSWSLAVAFVMANTAIETDSPTQSLVLFLHAARPDGVTEEMLERFIAERPFRDSRLRGLITDGLVELSGKRLVCRSSSRLLLGLLDGYRRAIGRSSHTG